MDIIQYLQSVHADSLDIHVHLHVYTAIAVGSDAALARTCH